MEDVSILMSAIVHTIAIKKIARFLVTMTILFFFISNVVLSNAFLFLFIFLDKHAEHFLYNCPDFKPFKRHQTTSNHTRRNPRPHHTPIDHLVSVFFFVPDCK